MLHQRIEYWHSPEPKEPANTQTGAMVVRLLKLQILMTAVREVKRGISHYGDKGIINSQDRVGGWPELKSKEAPADTYHEGMPDYWEKNNNLNPGDYTDRNDHDLDKDYTNIEYYLIKLVSNSD